MTKTHKQVLEQLIKDYSLAGVLHQLAEQCFENDSEECTKGEGNSGVWAHMGEALEELSNKSGC